MIKYIYGLCKEHNCISNLCIGPDGSMIITVFGKHSDNFLTIRADWDEEVIKDCIKSTIRRACDD